MKYLLSVLLSALFANAIAQNNVGIGTTTPNASAVLDVSSTTRGLLPPRMTAVQRNAINPALSARGLLVFDTDSSAFMFWNGMVWAKMGTSSVAGNQWTNDGLNMYNGNTGAIGIGVNDPVFQLDIAGRIRIRNTGDGNTSAGLWFNKNFNTGSNAFIGNRDDSTVGFYGNDGIGWGLMMNTKTGRVGIDNSTPNAPLQFSNAVQNRKIVLFEEANNDHQFYGFGINSGALRYQTNSVFGDHVFFSGINSTSSSELMRIKGNGNVGIGTVSPNSFGHGGNNRILDITNNTSSGANVQSHVVLSGTGTSGGMGGITWANYQLLGELRTGYIGNEFEANSSIPNTALTFSTRSTGLFERMRISSAGNVGIGTTNPARPLSFPATLEKKISLYPGGTGDAGFGVFGNELRINSDNAGADITMGFDNYTNGFTERMRVKGNGNVGIGASNPSFKLDVAGRIRVRADGNTAGIYFNNSLNDQLRGFIGMLDNDKFGLYGDAGAGWALTISTATGAVEVNNQISISGFTTLGEQAPAIKTKLITGTTSSIPLGFADVPHGLNRSKILGISILVTTIDGVDVGPGYFVTTGLLYNYQINASNVRITNPLLPIDCGLILLRPVRIFITYQE